MADTAGNVRLLHQAVRRGDYLATRNLLAHHPDAVDGRDEQGRTVLHLAAAMGREDLVALLLAHRASPEVQDDDGFTPLQLASPAPGDEPFKQEVHRLTRQRARGWPYPQVWALPEGRRSRRWKVLAFGLTVAALLCVAHPRLPLGWNRFDYVKDCRWFDDYAAERPNAMAGSGPWIFMATESRKLLGMYTPSRLPREFTTSSPVLDVAPGLDGRAFHLLLADGAVVRARPGTCSVAEDAWAPAPTGPVWPAGSACANAPVTLAACELDAQGLLCAAKGVGINRYSFARGPDGATFRRRGWQNSSLAELPLDLACFSRDRVFASEAGGGLVAADRSRLEPAPGGRQPTPPITRLTACPEGRWASATDQRSSLWLYPAAGSCWFGPFCGRPNDKGAANLRSLDDVKVVHVAAEAVHLGTPYGYFFYDATKRRISNGGIDGQICALLPSLPRGSAAPETLLVAADSGLHAVVGPDRSGTIATVRLDEDSVLTASLSPDGRRCVYRARSRKDRDLPPEVRVVCAPWTESAAKMVLAPAVGWKSLAGRPEIRDVIFHADRLLFLTDHGAFFYAPASHRYEDCSTVRQVAETTEPANAREAADFRALRRDGRFPTAIADGLPVCLPSQAGTGAAWTCLDPRRVSHPVQITEGDGHFIGMEEDGRLLHYGKTDGQDLSQIRLEMEDYCSGEAACLERPPAAGQRILGDLATAGDGRWSLLFVHRGSLCTYSSAKGRLEETVAGKWENPSAGLRQARLAGATRLLLDREGVVRGTDGNAIFPRGESPMEPSSATALAAGGEQDTVLLGGPAGEVLLYDWRRGAFQSLGGGPLPTATASGSVVRLEAVGPRVFALTAGRELFQCSGGPWERLPGYEAWTWDAVRKKLFLAGASGVAAVNPEKGFDAAARETWRPASSGTGMRKFLGQAGFAWKFAPDSVAVFGDKELGVFDSTTDNWQTRPGLDDPREFIEIPDGPLLVLDQQRVSSVTRELKTKEVLRLSGRGGQASMHLSGHALHLASVSGGRATLRTLPDWRNSQAGAEYARGGDDPGELALDRVVVGLAAEDKVLLIDDSGASALYDVPTGQWRRKYGAVPGQRLHGWFGSAQGPDLDLVLGLPGGKTRVLRVSPEGQSEVAQVGVPPEALAGGLQRAGKEMQSRAAASPFLAALACQFEAGASEAGKWCQGHVSLPGDGTVVETKSLLVRRQRGQTAYSRMTKTGWRGMAFSTGGFLDDAYTAMVFAPDGVLWGLRADGTQLVSLVPHEASKGLLPGDSVVELGAEADGVQRTPSGRIRVQRGNRTLGWLAASGDGLEPAAGAPQKSLASLPYGDWRLEIVWQDGEPLDVVVRHCVTGARAAKSAWSGSKDQLALQCVRDVALARDGALLLATEFGLIVRDAATGQVRSLYPDVSDARLLVNFPEGRLFVQAGETLGYQWNEAALQPFSARDSALPESSVQTGPWSWKASHRSALEQQVRVFHGKDARARRWQRASGGGWRFCDDCVRWIVRREVDEPPWLATDDGVWPVGRNLVRDPQRGELLGGRAVQHVRCPQGATWWWRGEGEGWRPMPAPGASPPRESAARADAPAEEFRVRNAALEVSYADGTLSLTPFDGPNQPVFTRRRLFCDCGDGVACWKGAIYVLVRGRCLLRRGLAQPGEITGCWCLPDPLPQDPPCELRGGADGLRLVVDFGAGRRQPAWDFAASPGVQPWRARTPELGKPAAQIGPFVWQRQVPQGLLAPAVARDAGRPPFKAVGPVAAGGFASQAVAEWWSGDRFAWDRVSDACMFGDGRAVLLSAAGPLIVELGDKSPPALTGFWPLPWFTSCETARDDHGRPLGVALSCPAGERLLSMDAGGTASIDPDPPAMPLCYRAAARLVSRAAAVPTGNRLQWTPWWAPVTRGLPATQEPILQSSLPQLPRELLLGDGQFRCDAAARAVEFAEGADSFWITFAPFSGPNGPETLVCLNQLDGGGQAEAGFLLRMAWRCPPHLDMLRPCGKLESVAVFREPGGSAENTFFGRARFNAAELQLSRAELPRVDPSRRIGGAVTLTAGRLDFGPRELFWGDEAQAPLEVKPADYPLWVRQGEGLSFAFDVLQGLSLGRGPEGRPQLALATRGGVLLADPAIAHGPTALSYPNVQLTLPCQPSGLIAASDASRVRHDASGQLWARFGPGLQVGKLAAGGWQFPASGWATELVPAGPFAVRFQSGKGMCVGDGPWHALSDDLLMPWDCHRKPLGSVLDVFYDADARALWVLDEHGLFKVLPDRLR